MIYAMYCIVALFLVVIIQLGVMYAMHDFARRERQHTAAEFAKERNQLLNRVMAGNIVEYRQQVVAEATAGAPSEQEMKERIMDQAFGAEWREMG